MKTRLVATGLAIALASGCATTADVESPGCDFFGELVTWAVASAFDAAFDTGSSKPDKRSSWNNNWAPSPSQKPSTPRLQEKRTASTTPAFAVTKVVATAKAAAAPRSPAPKKPDVKAGKNQP